MEHSTISRSVAVLATVLTVVALLLTAAATPAEAVEVGSSQKISETAGGFGGDLDPVDLWGHGLAVLGDLDGDGVQDLAAGAFGDDDGGGNTGAVWVLFMNSDGTVKAEQKISATQGGFTGSLDPNAVFGASMGTAGDLNGDGRLELAVGNYGDDDGGGDRGAVWILFLNSDGTVDSHQKISDTQGGFSGVLSNGDQFGHSVVSIGDLDGNNVPELAVGSWSDDDGGPNRGAVWILFMNSDGTVSSEQKISATQGGFAGSLADNEYFGASVAKIGDLDGDGTTEVAVGANYDSDGGAQAGAVWVLFMNPDGTVKSEQKISPLTGGLTGPIAAGDWFGVAVSEATDLDSDSVPDLVVGARQDGDGGARRGAVWLLFLDTDGTVKSEQKISSLAGGFGGLVDHDNFGSAVVGIDDLNGDGDIDIAAGAIGDDDGGDLQGAVWILFLQFDGPVVNVPPTIDAVSGPVAPVDINDQPINVDAEFSDPDGADTHNCTVDYGDGTGPQAGTIADGTCTGPGHTYAEAGVYGVEVTVTDDHGGFDIATFEFVVIYDPDGGFVTGGGWIWSDPGSCSLDAECGLAEGRASFGFVSKYKKGASTPEGNTEFRFQAGDLNFHSDSYDWMVIAGQDKAKYKGTGTINGAGNYGFMLTAVDNGNSGDTFRIKIWDKDNADAVVYDNMLHVGDDDYNGTVLGGGNIKVHKQ